MPSFEKLLSQEGITVLTEIESVTADNQSTYKLMVMYRGNWIITTTGLSVEQAAGVALDYITNGGTE